MLAAGLGTRLRPITYAMPKPMVPVVNRPVMEHIARLLGRHGFTETIANLHWFPELIQGHFGDGSEFGIELTYSHEERAARHGWRGSQRRRLPRRLVLGRSPATRSPTSTWPRCASFTSRTTGSHRSPPSGSPTPTSIGVVITDAEGRIQGFQEKPDPAEALSDLANCGVYMFRVRDLRLTFRPRDEQGRWPRRRPGGLRRLGDGRLPGAARGRRPFYSDEVRGLLERHRQPRRAAPGQPRRPPRSRLGRARRSRRSPPACARPALWTGSRCPARRWSAQGVEFGEGVRIAGPAIVGDGCLIGDGRLSGSRGDPARGGPSFPARAMAVGGVSGRIAKP